MPKRYKSERPSLFPPDKFYRWVEENPEDAAEWAEDYEAWEKEKFVPGNMPKERVASPAYKDNWLKFAAKLFHEVAKGCEDGDENDCEWLLEFGDYFAEGLDLTIEIDAWVADIRGEQEEDEQTFKEKQIAKLEAKGMKVITLD